MLVKFYQCQKSQPYYNPKLSTGFPQTYPQIFATYPQVFDSYPQMGKMVFLSRTINKSDAFF
jgi:hypothetical protein